MLQCFLHGWADRLAAGYKDDRCWIVPGGAEKRGLTVKAGRREGCQRGWRSTFYDLRAPVMCGEALPIPGAGATAEAVCLAFTVFRVPQPALSSFLSGGVRCCRFPENHLPLLPTYLHRQIVRVQTVPECREFLGRQFVHEAEGGRGQVGAVFLESHPAPVEFLRRAAGGIGDWKS